MIVGYGNTASGFVLYVDQGILRYEYDAAGEVSAAELELPSDDTLNVTFEFQINADDRTRTTDPQTGFVSPVCCRSWYSAAWTSVATT